MNKYIIASMHEIKEMKEIKKEEKIKRTCNLLFWALKNSLHEKEVFPFFQKLNETQKCDLFSPSFSQTREKVLNSVQKKDLSLLEKITSVNPNLNKLDEANLNTTKYHHFYYLETSINQYLFRNDPF